MDISVVLALVLDGNILLSQNMVCVRTLPQGSQQDVMLVFLNQDAYDRYRLVRKISNYSKEFEKEQKKAKEKADDKTKDGKKSKSGKKQIKEMLTKRQDSTKDKGRRDQKECLSTERH